MKTLDVHYDENLKKIVEMIENIERHGGIDYDDIKEIFTKEFSELALSSEIITLEFTWLELWVIFSNLQLALRHPENAGYTSKIAKSLALRIQEIVANDGALRIIAEMGWHESFDK